MLKVVFGPMSPESKVPPSSAVAVCATAPELVHVTVAPILTVTAGGSYRQVVGGLNGGSTIVIAVESPAATTSSLSRAAPRRWALTTGVVATVVGAEVPFVFVVATDEAGVGWVAAATSKAGVPARAHSAAG